MTDQSDTTIEVQDLEVTMTRMFDAPRELVFRAYTDPDLVPRWWGPRDMKTTVEELDVRPGGVYRFVHEAPDGSEYRFRGEYREVVTPERLVNTFEFEGMPGHIIVDAATFEDVDGKTRLTVVSQFASVEDRDGMLATGMEEGGKDTWDRLAELLAELQS